MSLNTFDRFQDILFRTRAGVQESQKKFPQFYQEPIPEDLYFNRPLSWQRQLQRLSGNGIEPNRPILCFENSGLRGVPSKRFRHLAPKKDKKKAPPTKTWIQRLREFISRRFSSRVATKEGERIENVHHALILPSFETPDYSTWEMSTILEWLKHFITDIAILDIVEKNRLTGEMLFDCFLNPKTSVRFCKKAGISDFHRMHIALVLGKVHNRRFGFN